jgi:hypothetical protein
MPLVTKKGRDNVPAFDKNIIMMLSGWAHIQVANKGKYGRDIP